MWYFLNWQEWRIEQRLNLLKDLNIEFELSHDKQSIKPLYGLSSGQEEVWNFVVDPTSPIKFYRFDCYFGRKVLSMFYDFWSWRFNG